LQRGDRVEQDGTGLLRILRLASLPEQLGGIEADRGLVDESAILIDDVHLVSAFLGFGRILSRGEQQILAHRWHRRKRSPTKNGKYLAQLLDRRGDGTRLERARYWSDECWVDL
jgi:hypothetical protein